MTRSQLRGLLAATAALAMLAAACSGGSPSQSGTGGSGSGGSVRQGGILKIGTTYGIDSMNPFVAFNQDAYSVFEQIYPMLIQYDTKTLEFVADFATKWETTSDDLTWTFHTVPNAKWSDGQALTAEDAAWTFNTIIKFGNGPTANWIGDFAHVASVTASDANTLTIVYKRPVANVLSNLQQVPILPQHVWSQYATGDGKTLKTTPNTPASGQPLVSGGPFTLSSYTKNDIALFTANPNFYGPKPHIQGWGLQYYSNDDAMVTALKTNQINMVETLPVTSVATMKSAGFVVSVGPGMTFRDFIFNSNPKKPNNRELLNPQVREAFEDAIDRDSIIKTAWLGYAQADASIVPPGPPGAETNFWHDPNVKPLPFDLNAANQILDSLGYAKGSDGIRVADGHPMAYTVIFPHAETGPGDRAFQIIQSDFLQIGVKLTQRLMDDTAAFTAITAPGETGYLNFDLAMWDWVPLIDPDFILSVLNCNQYGGWSDTGYCNPAYDQLYQQQGITIDRNQRQQIIFQMQEMVAKDRPYIVINDNDNVDAWSKDWLGVLESAQGVLNPLSKQMLEQVHVTG
jgi:peptide/nickel transport system substrate-binding protein